MGIDWSILHKHKMLKGESSMKILLVIALSLVSVVSSAKSKAEKAEWKEAQKVCMNKNSTLKGKKLKKCISEELKKEESTETKSEEKEEK
jgi:hypothetical protein